jgi:hypothetical protein
MAYMKMVGLAVVASAKGASPSGEKHSAKTTQGVKSGRSATAKEAKCQS